MKSVSNARRGGSKASSSLVVTRVEYQRLPSRQLAQGHHTVSIPEWEIKCRVAASGYHASRFRCDATVSCMRRSARRARNPLIYADAALQIQLLVQHEDFDGVPLHTIGGHCIHCRF